MDLFTQFESLGSVLAARPRGRGAAQTRRDQCPLTRVNITCTCVCRTYRETSVELHAAARHPALLKARLCAGPGLDLGSDSPLAASSSMGCLKRVMSLKVQRKRTTLSFSFLIGAICM